MPVKSSTGLKGVSIHRASNRLQAVYFRAGVTYLCGYFDDPAVAAEYRDKFIQVLEENWIGYLSMVSKFCVQSFVRFIVDNPELFNTGTAQQIHDAKIRVIKEYDTPADVKEAENKLNLAHRQRIQAMHNAKI